jgi:micrococcal nuclease
MIACLGLFAAGRLALGPPVQVGPTATSTPALQLQATKRAPPPAGITQGQPTAALSEVGEVVRVVDGDTIDVLLGGQTVPVRYIGIDTPERGEACGAEATAANERLVAGQTVMLVRDVSERDPFDRLLRYVYAGDVFVNAALVAQGYAQAAAFPPDTAHSGEFEALEAQAKAQNLGCHAMGALGAGGEPAPAGPAAGGSGGSGAACDPAYPTVCIPPFPPDLDCGDLTVRRFPVLPPDPHGFDGDGDGVGCQS